MSKAKGKQHKPWIVETRLKVGGSAWVKQRFVLEETARKKADAMNPQWFEVRVRYVQP